MFVICFSDKPMKMAKNVDDFSNIEYGGKYKVGCPPIDLSWKGAQSPCCPHNWGKQVGRSSTPCRKRTQVWGRESERWPKYMQQRCQC